MIGQSSESPHPTCLYLIYFVDVFRCRVRLKSMVMEGTFGKVYRGTYAEEDGGEEEVLVKTVTGK